MFASNQHEENFEVIERIGNGGYGSVYKVKNLLDNRIYALKKIQLESVHLDELNIDTIKVLKECRTLSLLDHPNILRYYGSWLVHGMKMNHRCPTISDPSPMIGPFRSKFGIRVNHRNDNEEHHEIVRFGRVVEAEDEDNSILESPNTKENPSWFKTSGISAGEYDDDDGGVSVNRDSFVMPQVKIVEGKKEDTLFIQTELCDTNLEEYLDERGKLIKKCQKQDQTLLKELNHDLEVHPFLLYESFSISLQIIEALRYIHSSQKLIHRDLKPSNIFLNIKSKLL